MTDTATAATCPPWCHVDHATEPADRHVGSIDLPNDLTVFLAQMRGEGVTAELYGKPGDIAEHGTIALSTTDIIRLAPVFNKLAGSLIAALAAHA